MQGSVHAVRGKILAEAVLNVLFLYWSNCYDMHKSGCATIILALFVVKCWSVHFATKSPAELPVSVTARFSVLYGPDTLFIYPSNCSVNIFLHTQPLSVLHIAGSQASADVDTNGRAYLSLCCRGSYCKSWKMSCVHCMMWSVVKIYSCRNQCIIGSRGRLVGS